jgi:hypothetical protein
VKTGVHVVERPRLDALRRKGLRLPSEATGVIDLLRLVRGDGEPPAAEVPIVVQGLDALLRCSAAEERDAMSAHLRRLLHEGKGYFEWKRIPLVFAVDATLTGVLDADGPVLLRHNEALPLAPLLGARLEPVAGEEGWWWGPQLG